jgi:cysteine desulfurase
MNKVVYMDHAATTPVKPEVLQEMLPYFTEKFGNPSSIYSIARESKTALETARERVAKVLSANTDEIYFTGGGSEADNWALKGIAFANKDKGNHIITTSIELHAVLHACQYLEQNGFNITYLPVDENGIIRIEDLEKALTSSTILVSVMFANNEIGTLQPIAEIGKLCRARGIYFHTDAVQAAGNVPINVKEMNIDLLSLSAHKFYGPKGVGALYIRKGVKIHSHIHGGGQERNRRAGTENVPGIVGLGKAIELAGSNMESHIKELHKPVSESFKFLNMESHIKELERLRDRLMNGLMEKIPYTRLNGHPEKRLPGNVNVCFRFIEGESLLLLLDGAGICASSGSACSSGSLDPSHVLLAIGLPHEIAHGSLRLTLGDSTTEKDVDYVIEAVQKFVGRLREMSPLYEEFLKKGE